jgi:soluble cytochrome b562
VALLPVRLAWGADLGIMPADSGDKEGDTLLKATLAIVLLSGSLLATAAEPRTMERTMKTMGFAFKLANEAATPVEALPHLEKLFRLTEDAKQVAMPADKAAVFQEGLDKVLAELTLAKQAAAADDAAKLQQHLTQVAQLRERYHKERRFSLWKLIFGRF